MLGAPSHLLEANGDRFLAYEDRGVTYVPTVPLGLYGYGSIFPISVPVPRACTTTVEVSGGRVVSWTLRGNDC